VIPLIIATIIAEAAEITETMMSDAIVFAFLFIPENH
jgi:hypothetical protein